MTNVCKCITCKHVAEMKKLIPNEALRNKVMRVTDDLYEAMASENLTMGVEIFKLKAEVAELKKTLSEISNGIGSLEGIKE